ncbi:oligosaccharide flippase family protein [Amylibacter sp.]|nr:oligosaccharide flippase family protein [Amylibacter sp.]
MNGLKNTFIYLTSNVIVALVPILILPIMTKNLRPEQYGVVAMFNLLIVFLGIIVGGNSVGYLVRQYYDSKAAQDISTLIINVLVWGSITAVTVTLTFIFLAEPIEAFTTLPIELQFLAIICAFMTFVTKIYLGLLQAQKKAFTYGLMQVAKAGVALITTYILVETWNTGISGRIYALSLASITAGLVSTYFVFKMYKPKINQIAIAEQKPIIRYGIDIFPHFAMGFVLSGVDRIIIKEKLGLYDLGIYSAYYQIGMGVMMIYTAANRAYLPWAFEQFKNKNHHAIRKLNRVLVTAIVIFTFIGFLLTSRLTHLLLDENYWGYNNFLNWFLIGSSLHGVYLLLSAKVQYDKDIKFLSKASSLAGIVNLLYAFFLIDIIGLNAIVHGYAIGNAVRLVLIWYYSHKPKAIRA